MLDIEKAINGAEGLICKKAYAYSNAYKPYSSGKRFMEFISYESAVSIDFLKAAYINAMLSFMEGRNIAKSIGVEFLLFAASTDQINTAIDALKPNEGSPFVVVSNDIGLLKDFQKSVKLVDFNKRVSSKNLKPLLEKMMSSRL